MAFQLDTYGRAIALTALLAGPIAGAGICAIATIDRVQEYRQACNQHAREESREDIAAAAFGIGWYGSLGLLMGTQLPRRYWDFLRPASSRTAGA